MERLTKRENEEVVLSDYTYEEMKDKFLDHVNDVIDCVNLETALEKLADYEDKQEQGLLIELPCKVGDTVYQIHTLPKSNRKVLAEVIADEFFITLCTLEKRFGKTVFLTRSEAEEALAKMGGNVMARKSGFKVRLKVAWNIVIGKLCKPMQIMVCVTAEDLRRWWNK